jgi:hypothetical protein
MKPSSRRIRRTLWLSAAAAAAAALIVPAVTTAVAAQPTSPAGTTSGPAPGYPPPKGIYAPFTNCPLKDPLMHEVMATGIGSNGGGLAACIAGNATSGSITIGTLTTPVVQPVNVQFGIYIPPEDVNFFPSPAVPPLAGPSAILSTKPDLIPESLTTALGCPSSVATVENICKQAAANPADNQVFALAQQVGDIRDFDLFTWTQAVKFQLINPLLGSSCSIGTDAFPVVLHPQLMGTPGTTITFANDPVPTVHPDSAVLTLNDVNAVDTTFSAPGVTGCGPGGAANVFVDEALDASSGVPAASGNSLTLTGSFALAVNFTSEDSSFTQPQDDASNLLAAFKASTNGEHSVKHFISMSQAKSMLSPGGFSR